MNNYYKESLRNLLETASSGLCLYRAPNLDYLIEPLNNVLRAAGLQCISRFDKITSINENDAHFNITVEYMIRQCKCEDTISLPACIVDSKDCTPVEAADRYWKNSRRKELVDELDKLEKEAIVARQRLVDFDMESLK